MLILFFFSADFGRCFAGLIETAGFRVPWPPAFYAYVRALPDALFHNALAVIIRYHHRIKALCCQIDQQYQAPLAVPVYLGAGIRKTLVKILCTRTLFSLKTA